MIDCLYSSTQNMTYFDMLHIYSTHIVWTYIGILYINSTHRKRPTHCYTAYILIYTCNIRLWLTSACYIYSPHIVRTHSGILSTNSTHRIRPILWYIGVKHILAYYIQTVHTEYVPHIDIYTPIYCQYLSYSNMTYSGILYTNRHTEYVPDSDISYIYTRNIYITYIRKPPQSMYQQMLT